MNFVIRVKTKEEWDIVSKFYNVNWADKSAWYFYKEYTCINPDGGYSPINYYNNNNYKILEFEEWEIKNNINNKSKSMEKQMLDVLNKTYDNLNLRRKTVPLFMSNPGIGKTSVIKKFAETKGVKMVKITLSQRMPNEVVGMVMPDTTTNKLLVYDSYELSNLTDGDILFFDEVFNGTLKQTLDAVLNLLEDRMLPSGRKLADVMIVAASNPQGLINLTPQIKERFIRYDLKFDNLEYQELLKHKYGMPESISRHLCTLINKEKFEPETWNFITPRSIEKAIMQIGCDLNSPHSETLMPFLSEELPCPIDITSLNVKSGENIPYINLLKLIVKNDNKNSKQESGVTTHLPN